MGIFDIFSRRKAQLPEPQPDFMGNSGPKAEEKSLYNHRGQDAHPFFRSGGSMLKLLDHCMPEMRVDVSPRLVLDEVRAVNFAFTPFTMAANRHAQLMGKAVIKSDDPKLQQELQDIANDLQLVTNNRTDGQHDKGLDLAVKNLLEWALLDGASFMEMQEDEENGGELRLRLYDSERFDIQRIQIFRDVLTFIQDNGALVYVPDTLRLIEFSPRRQPGKPWGIPMAYNATFFTDNLTRLIINERHARSRNASPPGFSVVTYDSEVIQRAASSPAGKSELEKLEEVRQTLGSLIKKSIDPMRAVNKQEWATALMPGGTGVHNMTLGSDLPVMGGFEMEFDRFANLAFLPTHMPYPFLGLQGPKTGFGSDEFSQQMKLLAATSDDHRKMVRPHARRIMDAAMDAQRMNPRLKDRYTIEFDAPDLRDVQKEATAQKTLHEAAKIGIENYMSLREMPGFSDVEGKLKADRYAAGGGFDYLAD